VAKGPSLIEQILMGLIGGATAYGQNYNDRRERKRADELRQSEIDFRTQRTGSIRPGPSERSPRPICSRRTGTRRTPPR
jgi:hypothetical protein